MHVIILLANTAFGFPVITLNFDTLASIFSDFAMKAV